MRALDCAHYVHNIVAEKRLPSRYLNQRRPVRCRQSLA